MENLSKYDAVLVCNYDDMVNEWDDRSAASKPMGATGGVVQYWDYDDPKLYAGNSFGRMLQQDLNHCRNGYSAKVSDFGKWVVVEMTCHNHISGRSASKTFLIVFTGGPNKGDGLVMSTANKWRSISGVSQAVSYISSACGALESDAARKL